LNANKKVFLQPNKLFKGQYLKFTLFITALKLFQYLYYCEDYPVQTSDDSYCKETVQSLSGDEEKFRTIAGSAKDAIIIMNEEGKISFWNRSAENLFGYSAAEAIGNKIHEILIPKLRQEQVSKQFLEFISNAAIPTHNRPLMALGKNGAEFPVEISLSMFMLDGKKNFLGIARDVTAQKLMEDRLRIFSEHLKSMVDLRTIQLKDANDRLAKTERLAAIGELAGMIGHDLRNPLTGIKTAAYYLRKKNLQNIDETGKNMLEFIDKDVDHANKIINDLLEYSRELDLALSETTPKSILHEALSIIKVPSTIQVLDNTLDEPRMKIDVGKVTRVFVNIIKNAIDAMPIEGKLEIRSRKKKNTVEISFSDTGTGISQENIEKIFTPLFTTKAQGMGFGLPICKRFVEAHGGKITVESTVDKGTTFTLTLPITTRLHT
jgi:PAS domain S-box-containing protein